MNTSFVTPISLNSSSSDASSNKRFSNFVSRQFSRRPAKLISGFFLISSIIPHKKFTPGDFIADKEIVSVTSRASFGWCNRQRISQRIFSIPLF